MSSDKHRRRRVGLAICSALLLSAGYPPLCVWWLIWLSLVPLSLAVLSCLSARSAFGLGFVAGTLWLLIVSNFIRAMFAAPSDLSGPMWPAWVALAVVAGGLTVGVSTTLLRFLVHRFHWPCIVALPVVWIVGEALRDQIGWGLAGISGEVVSLAVTQADQRIVRQIVELGELRRSRGRSR